MPPPTFLQLELTLPGAASKVGCGLSLGAINRLGGTLPTVQQMAAQGLLANVLGLGDGKESAVFWARDPCQYPEDTQPAHSSRSVTNTPALQMDKQKPREVKQLQGEVNHARSSSLSVWRGRKPVDPESPSISICYIAGLWHFQGPASPHSSWAHNSYQVCFGCGQP